MSSLTVEAGKVPPFEQGCVERGQRCVEEGLASIGGMPDGVREKVNLQKGFEGVAQHFAGSAHPRPPSSTLDFLGGGGGQTKNKQKKNTQRKNQKV